MEERLYRATVEGDAASLISLIQQDPLILDRRNTRTTPLLETPLHIAAMLGHEAFVGELLQRKPALARELDSAKSSALHLAAASGHVGIVKALLQADPDMCSVYDRDGRNPLHIAAMMGRVDVLKEMLVVGVAAARALTNRGGTTILHLCVEYSQFQALELLVGTVELQALVNSRDRNGNTVLHLAVSHKQSEMIELLVSLPRIELEAVNLNGMTAMGILKQRRFDVRDLEMEESLTRAGAIGAELNTAPTPWPADCLCSSHTKFKKHDKMKNKDDWLEKKRSALVIVASLIATMAFQVGVDPSSSEFKWHTPNTNQTNSQTSNSTKDMMYYAREGGEFLKRREVFYTINTTSFIASLSIILLMMSGLPLNQKAFVWTLMIITWVAISGLALSYTTAVILQTPDSNEKATYIVVGITVFAWICLVTLLLLGHTLRLFLKMLKVFLKMLKLLINSLFLIRTTPRHPPSFARV